MGRVIHFEIAADDLERAKKFYQVFGWDIVNSGMPGMEYWLAKTGTGDGIDGAIMPRKYSEKQPIRNTIAVDDIDDMIQKVTDAGGTIEGKKDMIPNIGWYVNGRDTEGNQFGMLQGTGSMDE